MRIKLTISNKAFWVPTWKLLTDYARRSDCSQTKTATTTADGTVDADVDAFLMPALLSEIAMRNERDGNQNKITIKIDGHTADERTKQA